MLDVCQHPKKYTNEYVQVHGVKALWILMTASSNFCEANLRLLVAILKRTPYPKIRVDILMGLSNLIVKFPNKTEPWLSHFYGWLDFISD